MLDLDPATYEVICIGNGHDRTTVDNLEGGGFEDIKVAHPNYFTDDNITTNDSLYYARKVIVIDDSYAKETIDFESSHLTFLDTMIILMSILISYPKMEP